MMTLKKILVGAALVIGSLSSSSQILKPVHWSYAAKKINNKEAVVFMKATIDAGWHIYSQHVKDGGPVKTSFTFTKSPDYVLAGETIQPTPITKYEKAFDMEVSYFQNSVIFQQKIKLKKGQVIIKGTLEYMTCNDQKCLPPEDVDFSIPIK